MSPGELAQLGVFLVTIITMVIGWARSTGKTAQVIKNLDDRVGKLEDADPVKRNLCDDRVAEYRAALSDAMGDVYGEIKEIKERLNSMDMSREKVSGEWDSRMIAVQRELAELRATTSRLCTAMEAMTKSVDMIMKKILKVD